jgi:hypothetical protein
MADNTCPYYELLKILSLRLEYCNSPFRDIPHGGSFPEGPPEPNFCYCNHHEECSFLNGNKSNLEKHVNFTDD